METNQKTDSEATTMVRLTQQVAQELANPALDGLNKRNKPLPSLISGWLCSLYLTKLLKLVSDDERVFKDIADQFMYIQKTNKDSADAVADAVFLVEQRIKYIGKVFGSKKR